MKLQKQGNQLKAKSGREAGLGGSNEYRPSILSNDEPSEIH